MMNSEDIQVSFIVPVYNVKEYIEKCLESLQNQTLDRFEIIVVEDCSTDGSLTKLRRLAAKDSRIRLILHEKNQGLGPARNTGLGYARGKYICFVDSDDWVDTGYGLAFYMEAERTSADMVVGTFYAVFSHGAQIATHFVDPAVRFSSLPFNIKTCPAVLSMPTPVWDKCYRREFLERHHLRFPALIGEDIPFQWEAMTQAERISVVNEPFYYYRIRASKKNRSLTAGRDIFADVFLAQEKALNFLHSSGQYESVKTIWWERMIKELLHLTEKSGDTLIADKFVAKVFHMMLRLSLEPVNFSLINRAYVPDHVLFMAMFARECESWKEFQELVAHFYQSKGQTVSRFLGVNKFQLALTQHDLRAGETHHSHNLTIEKYEASFTYYPDCTDYAAVVCENDRIILLPPIHKAEMEPAHIRVRFAGAGRKRLWYFLSCAQDKRKSELVIYQRVLGRGYTVIAEKETIFHVGEKIILSYLDIPEGLSINQIEVEFFVQCRSGFPCWASDVTISNFYGEGA